MKRLVFWTSGGIACAVLFLGYASMRSTTEAPARAAEPTAHVTPIASPPIASVVPVEDVNALPEAKGEPAVVHEDRRAAAPRTRLATLPTTEPRIAPNAVPSKEESPESEADEIAQLAEARLKSRAEPLAALALAGEGDRRFPRGQLHQEREALAIEALVRLGRMDEARARTDRFVASFPRSPFGERLRAIAGDR